MTADAEKDHAAYRQSVLDEFTASLKDEPGMPPAARRQVTQLFEQALQDAASQPRKPAEVLADWAQSVSAWNGNLEAMQKRGELSATDAADMSRQFDEITRTLQNIQADSGEEDSMAETTSAAPLPQGMPADVAQALGRSVRKP
jgi:hypothetical protein